MYAPTDSLLDGIRMAFPLQLFPWDDYFPRMAQADFRLGRGNLVAVKSFFIRNAPFGGSYCLMGGLTDALRTIADLRFDNPDFQEGMRDMGYSADFLAALAKRQRLQLQVFAPREGDFFIPGESAVSVRGPLADVRLAEGILTEAVNFASLNLTKWSRLVRTVRPGRVMEFARRRAQNAAKATLYGILAGCSGTSNAEMRRFFKLTLSATTGHEWISSFGDVRESFDAWLETNPDRPIGLIDTKECLGHDFPAWLESVWAHREAIKAANPLTWGWRNDSGDLAYLTIEQYVRFWRHQLVQDPWFAERMRIILTNDLDEYTAESIIQQIYVQAKAAGLDAEDIIRRIIWAAGTKPGTCYDQPSLGGVVKLQSIGGLACIKLAFDASGLPGIKTSIPGFNLSARVYDGNGELVSILMYPYDHYRVEGNGRLFDFSTTREVVELNLHHPDNAGAQMSLRDYHLVPQQGAVYDTFEKTVGFTEAWDHPTLSSVPARIMANLDDLHWSHTRLDKPHAIKLSVTPDLFDLRRRMIEHGALREDKLPA